MFGQKMIAQIGTGARSVLYAVQDPRTREVFTLKHVRLESTDKDDRWLVQVEQEYAIGSKLDHPALRSVKQVFRSKDGLKFWKRVEVGLLMEFIDGESLDHLPIESNAQVVRIFARVARGLAHMHQKGFVHADMKPNNIMITSDGVKVIDLGQACANGEKKKRIQGTPGYIAPEQGHREAITPVTDIYNFGATMYWTVVRDVIPTVVPPGTADGAVTAIPTASLRRPDPPQVRNQTVHPLLGKIILDCVEPQPADRCESMGMIAQRLEDLQLVLDAAPGGFPLRIDSSATAPNRDI
ncbi:MAG: serine/threonine-protein kinase [Planctomycetota bacterium]|nr:serine/threonine-protein kinase [Planctomycetota bacterium]